MPRAALLGSRFSSASSLRPGGGGIVADAGAQLDFVTAVADQLADLARHQLGKFFLVVAQRLADAADYGSPVLQAFQLPFAKGLVAGLDLGCGVLGGNHLEALDVFAGCGIDGGDGGHGGFSFVSVYRLKERAPPNVPSVIGRTASPTVPHPLSSFPRRRESSVARRVIALSPMIAAMPATSRRTLSRTILFLR